MRINALIAASVAPLAIFAGIGLAAPATGQETANVQAATHEQAMKQGRDHAAAQLAALSTSDASDRARLRSEHEAAMRRGASHSTAQQATAHKSVSVAVNATAKRHAESMAKGRDHAAAQLESNEAQRAK